MKKDRRKFLKIPKKFQDVVVEEELTVPLTNNEELLRYAHDPNEIPSNKKKGKSKQVSGETYRMWTPKENGKRIDTPMPKKSTSKQKKSIIEKLKEIKREDVNNNSDY